MSQDHLAQAFARLKSLKDNLPQDSEVDQKYVAEYHEILDLLQTASGSDLKSFRIPVGEIHPEVSGGNYITGQVDYSDRQVCERAYLAMKVDGLLGFFTFKTSPRKKEFGFKTGS